MCLQDSLSTWCCLSRGGGLGRVLSLSFTRSSEVTPLVRSQELKGALWRPPSTAPFAPRGPPGHPKGPMQLTEARELL